jgi:hypothetical protein
VCNTSTTQAHTLEHVSVQIASFSAYTGQLNQWEFADTKCFTTYTRPQGVSGGGCGGAVGGYVCFHVTFPAGAGTGSAALATLIANLGCMTGGAMPLQLPPGQMLDFALGITRPNAAGIYSFAVSLVMESGTLALAPTDPVLLAPVAHKWNGEACTTAAMQAQIPPATNPPTAYICPQ